MKIYLDNAATTQTDPEVLNEMKKYHLKDYANPSSIHDFGLAAKETLNKARQIITDSIKAQTNEVIFTGSGTESNNLVLKGLFFQNFPEKNHIITTEIEHDCILNACKWLETRGAEITYLKVDEQGLVNSQDLAHAITDETIVVSIIHGNNEIGTIQNLAELGKVCHEKNVLFHSDACQSYTKTEIDVNKMNLDFLTLNAHKIHGPKGVGALYIKTGNKLTPLLHGGGQEFNLRSSTENIAGIMGFAKAVEITNQKNIDEMIKLRDYFITEITKSDKVKLNGPSGNNRLCNNINISFFMQEGEWLHSQLNKKGIYVSTGSACSSGSTAVSHVIKAINTPMEYLHGNIRLSISKYTTKKELKKTISIINKLIEKNNLKQI